MLLNRPSFSAVRILASAAITALSLFTTSGATAAVADPLPAFPGAEGFGAIATGGRGGEVYHVVNLDDAGPGSLRDAVSKENRIVIFDVGGIIRTKSQITSASNITIAGQSAPGDGITVYGPGISFSGQSNIICRYLRLRGAITNDRGSKQLNVTGGSKMIFDHLSLSWGRWDNIGFTKVCSDMTLQDCIVGEAIDPQRFGAIIDGPERLTVVRNLWVNNQNRNPKGKAQMQYINNIIYNWGSGGYAGAHSLAIWRQDLINNYLIKGPSSNDNAFDGFGLNDHLFVSGNLVDMNMDGKLNGAEPGPEAFGESDPPKPKAPVDGAEKSSVPKAPAKTAPIDGAEGDDALAVGNIYGPPKFFPKLFNASPIPVKVLTAAEAYEKVAASAGCSIVRDSHDARMINALKSLGKDGAVIKEESAVGGIGELKGGVPHPDGDKDGIPDAWEKENKLNPTNPKDAGTIDSATGYMMLEIYLNGLVK